MIAARVVGSSIWKQWLVPASITPLVRPRAAPPRACTACGEPARCTKVKLFTWKRVCGIAFDGVRSATLGESSSIRRSPVVERCTAIMVSTFTSAPVSTSIESSEAPMIAKLRALKPPPKNSTPSSELLNETRFSITVPEPAPPVVSDWSSLFGASSKPEKRIWLKRNEPELSAPLAPPNGVAVAAPSRRPSQVGLLVGAAVVLNTPVEQSEIGARPSSTTPPHCCWLLSLARPRMLSRLVHTIGRSAVPFDWIALPRLTTRNESCCAKKITPGSTVRVTVVPVLAKPRSAPTSTRPLIW